MVEAVAVEPANSELVELVEPVARHLPPVVLVLLAVAQEQVVVEPVGIASLMRTAAMAARAGRVS